jgi:hypothetical protein
MTNATAAPGPGTKTTGAPLADCGQQAGSNTVAGVHQALSIVMMVSRLPLAAHTNTVCFLRSTSGGRRGSIAAVLKRANWKVAERHMASAGRTYFLRPEQCWCELDDVLKRVLDCYTLKSASS